MKKSVLSLLAFALLAFALVGCGSTSSTTVQVPSPTAKPAQSATATQIAQSGATTLGQPLSHFIAKYGQPNAHSDAKSGAYHLQRYGNSNIDFLILQTDIFDGSANSQSVMSINAQSPEASWTVPNADTICNGFLPSDAVSKSTVPITSGNGYDKIYFSQSLASLFPPSAFSDANQNQVQAGMFDVQYLTKSQSDPNIVNCDIQVGTEQTQ